MNKSERKRNGGIRKDKSGQRKGHCKRHIGSRTNLRRQQQEEEWIIFDILTKLSSLI
jgi:hypothetical protein